MSVFSQIKTNLGGVHADGLIFRLTCKNSRERKETYCKGIFLTLKPPK